MTTAGKIIAYAFAASGLLLMAVVAKNWVDERSAPPPPETFMTGVDDKTNQQIIRLKAAGRYLEAHAELVRAIQLGDEPPKIGQACMVEYQWEAQGALQCIERAMERRRFETDTGRLERAYRSVK